MSRKKIVAIDNDHSTLQTLEQILESHNYIAFVSSSGRAGIELVKQTQPDLVICDVEMPDMSGYDVLLTLRRHAATAAIPVLLLSAQNDATEIRHGMKLGADDFLTKPCNAEELLHCVAVRIAQRENIVRYFSEQLDYLRRSIALRLPHEFRTPLNSLIVFGELLASDYDKLSREQAMEMIATIVSSGHRLSALVENFIYLARLEIAASQNHVKEEFAASPFVGCDAIIAETAKHQVAVYGNLHHLDIDLAPATLFISDAYIRKVVTELVGNACKFSQPHSTVVVRGEQRGKLYVLSVSDQGRGMSSEQVSRIGAYMQFDREYHEQQGQGLGLEIAKRIIELHDGNFSVQSQPNVGTTIQVYLPSIPTER
jgi:signal transduction histidine kinase